MKIRLQLVVAGLLLLIATDAAAAACDNLLDFSHRRLASSQEENLCEAYAGKVLLVVNTASRCGFTGQFSDLEGLYQKYRDDGLVVLGFPSDDFNQELDAEEDTADVCYVNYGVTFPMFATTGVLGEDANALFAALAEAEQAPRWNFTKYLIGRDGGVIESFGSRVEPLDSELEQAVVSALTSPSS
ncbi:glutathione peroxidase [Wenzhouxiangella limi]|uniref:Glutathione peroxidase n=1 Tax=Wenzhouxiangella limi TaxID=2707351 RepID=A0A845V4N4_9GAMM|nr:glutathione peroxidase [Wenzhouxiangella limi]NDY94915.1 glutathione peroxidase [Wenzhouxiangella limi]